ncbi:hypothetical protein V866_003462 [Kwoniella sp. B9012]|uniref:Zn(2)-C6 fungal-type domain-containing protein n=1 Tax=Kwoniella europaea PYCC6329 TaxID=1423913 RepID=A0AAX4KG21_9TREE
MSYSSQRTGPSINDSDATTLGKPKTKACDTCRIRKVRCTFAPPLHTGESSTKPCILCKKHGFACTYERKPKKVIGSSSEGRRTNDIGVRARPIAPVSRRPKEPEDAAIGLTHTAQSDRERQKNHRKGISAIPEVTSNPFDEILPRQLLLSAISTFFDHLYCLTPLVHKPTFVADLKSRREEQPENQEWVSLVLMLVAATLVQAPWAFPQLQRKEIEKLAKSCYGRGKVWLVEDFREITVGRYTIADYAHRSCMVSAHLEEIGMAEMFRGSLWGLIFKLRMHEESSYEGLDPIEGELRRRVFWLAFGLDKARCAVHADMVHVTGEHCADVQLPKALDDEYISRTGYVTPSTEETPILLGFCYVSRIFEMLGQALDLRRIDRRRNPTGIHLQMRLNEVNGLLELCETIMDDCPPALRLNQSLDPSQSQMQSRNSFLVQQANIYMTQQMTRQLLMEYRAQLRALQRHQQLEDLGQAGMPLQDMHLQSGLSDEEKECVSRDVLNVLEAIPMQALAVNTTGVVNKVRFVAVSLLDGLSENGAEGEDGTGGTSRSQYHREYLWKFLTTLGEIEAMSSLKEIP